MKKRRLPLFFFFSLSLLAVSNATWPPSTDPLIVEVVEGGVIDLLPSFERAASRISFVSGSGLVVIVVPATGGAGFIRDGKNRAGWGPYSPGSGHAHGRTWRWDKAGVVQEADILFDPNACWVEGLPDGHTPSNGSCPLDLETVVLHELIHLLGEGHALSSWELPNVMEPTYQGVRRQLFPANELSLSTSYPPRLLITPIRDSLTLREGMSQTVLSATLRIQGTPLTLRGMTVRSVHGEELNSLSATLVREGEETLLTSVIAHGTEEWSLSWESFAPQSGDTLKIVASRALSPAWAFLLFLPFLSRRKRLLTLLLVIAGCGGGGVVEQGWHFEGTLILTDGDIAIEGGDWLGPNLTP